MLQYMKRSEETEQITLIHWCNVNICKYPELELIYHVPNGGKRNKSEAIRLKLRKAFQIYACQCQRKIIMDYT